jgi:hypothetical protein
VPEGGLLRQRSANFFFDLEGIPSLVDGLGSLIQLTDEWRKTDPFEVSEREGVFAWGERLVFRIVRRWRSDRLFVSCSIDPPVHAEVQPGRFWELRTWLKSTAEALENAKREG